MPIPTGFPQVTKVLGKPESWEEGSCLSLPIFTDGHRCVSRWSLSQVEIEKLMETGHLWLTIHSGQTQPPVAVDVLPPLKPETPAASAPELNGVSCPRCKSTGGIRRLTFMWIEERVTWSGMSNGKTVGPSTSVCECLQCGYQVSVNDENESREIRVCRAIHQITGEQRGTNESMEAYQSRLIERFGPEWPEMLGRIVTAVMLEE